MSSKLRKLGIYLLIDMSKRSNILNNNYFLVFGVLCILFYALFSLVCTDPGPRNLDEATKAAIYDFHDYLFEETTSEDLFEGPELVGEDSSIFVFRWVCKVPLNAPILIEEYTPKDHRRTSGYKEIGPRKRCAFLGSTRYFSLNEAALCNLFDTAPDPDDKSARSLRLRRRSLDSCQIEDIANLVEIKSQLNTYEYYFPNHFPESLDSLLKVKDCGNMYLPKLDSIYIHDRYGNEYYYENMITFLLLGTPGKNRIWDFNQAILDTIKNEADDFIFINKDDILVKLDASRF